MTVRLDRHRTLDLIARVALTVAATQIPALALPSHSPQVSALVESLASQTGSVSRPDTGPASPAAPLRPGSDTKPTFVLKQFAPGQSLHMVAYGDMRFTDPANSKGTNPRIRQYLVDKIALEKPQVLLLTGDMPYTGDKTADWEEYQKETRAWKAQSFPVFPTIGNHEIYNDKAKGIANYLENYPHLAGHRYYSALLGSVEILSLDMTTSVAPRSDQARWFSAQLEHLPPQVEFLLILYHLPWLADEQSRLVAGLPTRDSQVLRGILRAALPKMRAKVVVFNGHIHNYERFEEEGVEYVVTGGGGAVPYPVLIRGKHDLYKDPGYPVYNFLTVEVHDHQLQGVMWKVIDPDSKSLEVEAKDNFVVHANPVPASSAPRKASARR